MGLMDRFTRPKYEALFHSCLQQIAEALVVEIRIDPQAATAIVQNRLDLARGVKRRGISGSRTMMGMPIEQSYVQTAARLTAYVLVGTQVMPASEAEREPFLGIIQRHIAPALLVHDSLLSDDARQRIARIIGPRS